MAKTKSPKDPWRLAGQGTTVVAGVLTALVYLFPQLNSVGIIGGSREVVAQQVSVFAWVAVIVIFAFGVCAYVVRLSAERVAARAIAQGRDAPGFWARNWPLVSLALCTILIGFLLPRSVFGTTDNLELNRQFQLGALAVRSWLGSLAMGLFLLASTMLVAFVIYRVHLAQRDRHLRRLERQMVAEQLGS